MSEGLRRLAGWIMDAPAGNRDLSEQVLLHLGWILRGRSGGPQLWFTPERQPWKKKLPSPTLSIDDAAMLIPEGWDWELSVDTSIRIKMGDDSTGIDVTAATIPLAITAAVLKVRAREREAQNNGSIASLCV